MVLVLQGCKGGRCVRVLCAQTRRLGKGSALQSSATVLSVHVFKNKNNFNVVLAPCKCSTFVQKQVGVYEDKLCIPPPVPAIEEIPLFF